MPDTKTLPRLMLGSKIDRDSIFSVATLKVALHVVYLNEDYQVRNPSFTGYFDDTLGHLDGFVISAYYSPEMGWYGYSAEYRDIYSIGLDRAELMVKTLRKLTKKLDADQRAYGYVTDFPTYCVRVAEAIGAKLDGTTFGLDAPKGQHVWMSGDRYRWADVDSLRSRLNDLANELALASAS